MPAAVTTRSPGPEPGGSHADSHPTPSRTPPREHPRRIRVVHRRPGVRPRRRVPASAPGEGVRGRGLFHTGDAPDVPVVRTPIDVTLCVPELVGPDAPAECADGVRAMYKAWSASLDVDVPEPIVDFLCHAECPKDLRWRRR